MSGMRDHIFRVVSTFFFFFFKQKTAYEILADWSSDVCSSDLVGPAVSGDALAGDVQQRRGQIDDVNAAELTDAVAEVLQVVSCAAAHLDPDATLRHR